MNKLLFSLGAASLIFAATSCSNDSKSNANKEAEADKTEQVAEAPKSQAEINLEAGKAYLDDLKANDPDVKFTESGLGYKVIKEGKGANPTVENTANVKYTGKHINGEVFDSSNGQTVAFPLSRVVPGFTEGIILMNPGAVYELYLPANLAYGQMGTPGGPIGPNETLIFEVELVDFE